MGILDGLLTQLANGDNLKDFQHASKLFVGDNFRLAPKMGFLYHVFFDLDPTLCRIAKDQQIESGMLVKSVDLPRFSVESKTLNSYNKPNVIQTKIKYDSLSISFHDDHADVIRNLWFDYYHYYYRDSDFGYADKSGTVNPNFFQPTKYALRTNNNFGYTPRNYSTFTADVVNQYIKSIRIYSLHQKRFSEYTLVNPVITSFKHGQHQAGSGEPMSHEMTISYEFVLYASGNVSKNTVKGFADIHYDTIPSPLTPAGGGTRSLLGPGGIFDTADDIVNDLSKDPPDYASALFKGFRGLNNLKNMNLKNAAKNELSQIGMDVLRGNNPLNRVSIPNIGGLASLGIAAGASLLGGNRTPGVNSTVASSRATSNGNSIGAVAVAATAGTALAGLGTSVQAGTSTTAIGLPSAGGAVTGAGDLNKMINIDPATGVAAGVGILSALSPAAQKIANIPGGSANQVMDSYLQNYVSTAATDTAATLALREGADAAAQTGISKLKENKATTIDSLNTESSTPSEPLVAATNPETGQTYYTTASQTPTNTSEAQLTARSDALNNLGNATLNDDTSYQGPTNQGSVDPGGDYFA